MKTRLLNFAALVVGALTIVLTLLQRLPKYAAIAGSALLVIADVEKMFPTLVATVKKMFPTLASVTVLLLVSLPACSFLTSVKNSCEPSKSDATAIVADLTPTNYASLLEAEGIKVGVCVVDKVVADFVAQHSPSASALTSAKAEDSAAVVHGRAWLAAHPAR